MKVIPWGLYQRSKQRKPNSATDKNITVEKLMMERSESRTNAKNKILVLLLRTYQPCCLRICRHSSESQSKRIMNHKCNTVSYGPY